MPDKSPLARAHEAIDRLYGEYRIACGDDLRVMTIAKEAHAALEEVDKRAEMRGRLAAVSALYEGEKDA